MNPGSSSSPNVFPMNGGNGLHSYVKNSAYQRRAVAGVKRMLSEAIAETLDLQHLSSSSPLKSTFCIADMGCSVGQNTFIAMQNIIADVEYKYRSQGLRVPEIQVFFNDHSSNDFNKLLNSVPSDINYFAAAVPGSFFGRLFPAKSINFFFSSYALQWLSKVPKQVEDVNSPAWNKGRISYEDAPPEVEEAYRAQFAADMERFLLARAQELVSGGLMALILPTYVTKISPRPLEILGSIFMDLVKKGRLDEAKVNSFNMPIYVPSAQEFKVAIENNRCFTIKKCEVLTLANGGLNAQTCSMTLRAGFEGLFSKHFGNEIMDELFGTFEEKIGALPHIYNSETRFNEELFLFLERS